MSVWASSMCSGKSYGDTRSANSRHRGSTCKTYHNFPRVKRKNGRSESRSGLSCQSLHGPQERNGALLGYHNIVPSVRLEPYDGHRITPLIDHTLAALEKTDSGCGAYITLGTDTTVEQYKTLRVADRAAVHAAVHDVLTFGLSLRPLMLRFSRDWISTFDFDSCDLL
ncbi:hypothetical protein BDV97DRAFT_106611 [Delphinella strobiligena]|nr:hypothetical protein BDV97DRAFT_106611 [Delphinella strobiligena]